MATEDQALAHWSKSERMARMMLTNKEAVEQLRNLKKANFYQSTIIALDMAIEALKQTAWIPVGERLPRPYRHVLVSLDSRYDGDATYDWITETFDGKLKWYDWDGHVIAWMPLPEPYKGGDADAD